MKQKLLELPSSQWYTLSGRADRDKITAALTELIAEGSKFVVEEDHFQRLSCDLFDKAGEPGYSISKHGIAEYLMYRGRTLAIR